MNTDKIKQYTNEIEELEAKKKEYQDAIEQIDKDIEKLRVKIKMEV